ncbi:conserved exported hypothetical protein [Arthrobacter sp. 9AX]|uniref:hypothetical protein n=1 Tax=Arthrobacter sp. 9AX TaxID=2653131 RepID=UPI0012EFA8D2|nr:hypothetical protein [Arthrobacter sp. 9AX]VXB49777.1 conserved exported hypothetical protein [Arthrobacter sp. 9AX]
MRGKATTTVLSGVSLLLAGVLLTGCSGGESGQPGWTAQPGPSGSAGAAAPVSADGSSSTAPSSGSTATASGAPQAVATAAAWKSFSDPGKTVSFDLPEDWIAQSVTPEEGTLPGALKIEVKKPDGTFMAALRTGLPPSSVECPEPARRAYTVVSSVPVELSAAGGEGTIPPRVVFRVIQGYKYFGSYGVTNLVGGADGQACELRNILRGPAGKGDYSFGDVVSVRAFAPDEKVAPAKAFDTLDQAARYVNEGSEFANVQRMLMSLKIKN